MESLIPLAGTMAGSYGMQAAFGQGAWQSAVGGFLGQYASGFLLPAKKVTNEQPRLGDLALTSSGYGGAIPLVFGVTRVAGNVIDAAPQLHEVQRSDSETSGKGAGRVKTKTIWYDYYATFALSLCEGPIEGVRRIWANGELIYDRGVWALDGATHQVPAAQELKADDDGVVIAPGVTLFSGSETQLPSPVLEVIHGAGNVPAYRGLAYLLFDHLPLAKFGNALPNIEVEVERLYAYQRTGTAPGDGGPVVPDGPLNSATAVAAVDYDYASGALVGYIEGTATAFIQRSASDVTLVNLPVAPGYSEVLCVGGVAYFSYPGLAGVGGYIALDLNTQLTALVSVEAAQSLGVAERLHLPQYWHDSRTHREADGTLYRVMPKGGAPGVLQVYRKALGGSIETVAEFPSYSVAAVAMAPIQGGWCIFGINEYIVVSDAGELVLRQALPAPAVLTAADTTKYARFIDRAASPAKVIGLSYTADAE